MDKDLRNSIVCFSVVIVILAWFFLFVRETKSRYCGVVNEMYRTSAGYKVREQPRIIFYNDSLKRNINIQVSYNTYSNTKIGEFVCFGLYKHNLD